MDTEQAHLVGVAKNLGFSLLDTGGDITAFSKVLHDGTVILITGEDGLSIPAAGEERCVLSHYVDDSLEAYVTNYGSPHTLECSCVGDVDECFAEAQDRLIKSKQLGRHGND